MNHTELVPMIPEATLYLGIVISLVQGTLYSPVRTYKDVLWQMVYGFHACACVLGIVVLHMTD